MFFDRLKRGVLTKKRSNVDEASRQPQPETHTESPCASQPQQADLIDLLSWMSESEQTRVVAFLAWVKLRSAMTMAEKMKWFGK